MDEAGIDLQVLSHSIPGLQGVDAATAVPLARRVNDRLAETVRAHPDRFAAFAALPTADPRAAADELERTVTKLGFKGAMINGLTGGTVFHDDRRFWPIYERAAALDVPIYIHPTLPHPAVIEAYYKDYVAEAPGAAARRLGLHGRDRDAGRPFCAVGRVRRLSRTEDDPRPSGRGAAVLLWRISHGLRASMSEKTFRDDVLRAFLDHHQRLLLRPGARCAASWRWASTASCSRSTTRSSENPPGTEWIKTLPLGAEDREKLLNGNARRLLEAVAETVPASAGTRRTT